MDIKTLSDLSKLADVCRKKGIETIKVCDGVIEFKLLDRPLRSKRSKNEKESIETTPQYTEEDLILWSSTEAQAT